MSEENVTPASAALESALQTTEKKEHPLNKATVLESAVVVRRFVRHAAPKLKFKCAFGASLMSDDGSADKPWTAEHTVSVKSGGPVVKVLYDLAGDTHTLITFAVGTTADKKLLKKALEAAFNTFQMKYAKATEIDVPSPAELASAMTDEKGLGMLDEDSDDNADDDDN